MKVAIIGAGLSGLTAAHFLNDCASITIFEKARGVGGRMSTRQAGSYFFDHGAQYFTARTKPFQNFIQPLLNQGIIQRWDARWVKFDNAQIVDRKNWINDEPRYVGVPGMNKICRHLAENLNVLINTKISSMQYKRGWELFDESGQVYRNFDWVISTVPSPQVQELFPKNFSYHELIKTIKMKACFSLMLGFEKKLPLDFEVAHVSNSDLSWVAVNSHKPERSNDYTLVVHSSVKYAEAHINTDRKKVLDHLLIETSRILDIDVSDLSYSTIHGWRYANNETRVKHSVFLDKDHRLAVCGDWCLGGRVEGSFTSAYNLVNKIKKIIL
mgnify:CR=1 FL=1